MSSPEPQSTRPTPNGDQVEKTLKRKLVLGGETSIPELGTVNLKKVKEDGSPSTSDSSPAETPKPTVVPGGGFSSFASTSSPFITTTTASSSSTSSPTASSSSNKPKTNVPTYSAFLPASGASPFTSAGPKSVASPTTFNGANAFSAFASSNPFAVAGKKKESVAPKTEGDPLAESEQKDGSFGDILTKVTEDESADSPWEGEDADRAKEESGLKMEAKDVVTGEEEEDTKHQVRCKLYVMEKDGGWKERGTGLFKLNVHSLTKTPRLLMRADGIFRLILNVALFSGMKLEKQDKWVRFTVFEDSKPSHLAVRVGTLKSAEDLYDKITSFIPPPKSTIDRSKTYALAPFEKDSPAEPPAEEEVEDEQEEDDKEGDDKEETEKEENEKAESENVEEEKKNDEKAEKEKVETEKDAGNIV